MTRKTIADGDIRTEELELDSVVPDNFTRHPAPDSGRIYASEIARLAPEIRRPLEEILAPLDLATFFRRDWGKRVLHVKNRSAASRFRGLFSSAEMLRMFRSSRIPQEYCWFHADTTTINKNELMTDRMFDYDAVLDFLQNRRGGAVLPRLSDYHGPAGALALSLSEIFRCQASINAYYGSRSNTLFPFHWDTHDTLILQVEGEKSWEFNGSLVELPLSDGQHSSELYALPERRPARKLTMREGDALYVPRGVIHRAATTGETSLHLTCALFPPAWFDVLRMLTRQALALYSADLGSREACPMLPASGANARVLKRHLSKTIRRFARTMESLDARGIVAANEAAKPLFLCLDEDADLRRRRPLTAETRLVRRSGVHAVFANKKEAVLLFNRKRLTFPPSAGPALRALSRARSTRIDRLPGPLDAKGRIALASRLVREGFLYAAS